MTRGVSLVLRRMLVVFRFPCGMIDCGDLLIWRCSMAFATPSATDNLEFHLNGVRYLFFLPALVKLF